MHVLVNFEAQFDPVWPVSTYFPSQDSGRTSAGLSVKLFACTGLVSSQPNLTAWPNTETQGAPHFDIGPFDPVWLIWSI